MLIKQIGFNKVHELAVFPSIIVTNEHASFDRCLTITIPSKWTILTRL
jgi:hypothetical protein